MCCCWCCCCGAIFPLEHSPEQKKKKKKIPSRSLPKILPNLGFLFPNKAQNKMVGPDLEVFQGTQFCGLFAAFSPLFRRSFVVVFLCGVFGRVLLVIKNYCLLLRMANSVITSVGRDGEQGPSSGRTEEEEGVFCDRLLLFCKGRGSRWQGNVDCWSKCKLLSLLSHPSVLLGLCFGFGSRCLFSYSFFFYS